MKLAVSNIAWEQSADERMYAIIKEKGFSGLEIAPTRIFAENPYGKLEQAADWSNDLMQSYGFSVASMQSIWFGRTEKLFGAKEERQILLDYTRQAIDFAKAVQCGNLMLGCPKNRNVPDHMEHGSVQEIAEEFFRTLGEYAAGNGTVLAIEPNPAIYGTNFINTTEDAFAFVKRINSRGFRVNLDVGTMLANGETPKVIMGKTAYINHVHISEPGLGLILQRDLHRDLIKILKEENYQGFISIEMGKRECNEEVIKILDYVRNRVEE